MDQAPSLPTSRPPSLMVCGIINLAYAALGFFGLLGAVVITLIPAMSKNNPALKLIQKDHVYAICYYATQGLGVVSIVLLVAAGIGLFKARDWARKLTLIWAIYAVLMTFAGALFQMAYLPAMLQEQLAAMPNVPAGLADTMKMAMTVGLGFGILFGIAYPVVAWILLTRPRVQVYCKHGQL